jgi:large subunit ribosomal protein L18
MKRQEADTSDVIGMEKTNKDLKFRRRMESVTDYRKRLELVKSGIDRLVVRKTNSRIIGQIIKYSPNGDIVIAHADSSELKKFDWSGRSNRPTAYLTGLLLAKKSRSKKGERILDIGLASPVKNSIPFIFAKGCIDGGMEVRGNMDINDTIYNCSNTKYISELKSKDNSRYQKHYSAYLKSGVAPEDLAKVFNNAKDKINSEDLKQ